MVNFKNGVRVVTVPSWQDFRQEAIALKSKRGFVWRGQTRDRLLRPSFDRAVVTKDPHYRIKKLERHLETFRIAMDKSYPNVLPKSALDAWALGQHYGLMSPFLDWTTSSDIAAYFAFIKKPDPSRTDKFRFVYALDRSIERLVSKLKLGGMVLTRDQSVPFVDHLVLPNPRFIAQKGLFTNQLHGKGIEEFVNAFAGKKPGDVFLVKFRIPTKFRDECLEDLQARGIDHTTLLLDLSDVVDECNKKL